MANEKYDNLRRLHHAQGGLHYGLEVFGDELAKREKYSSLCGMDAIHLYLIRKYSWLPRDVTTMTAEHIRLVLSEEMHGWTLPPEAR